VVVGRPQQRTWTAEEGSARSVVEDVAEELGPSLRWGDGNDDQDHEELQPVADQGGDERDATAVLRSAPVYLWRAVLGRRGLWMT
jgi:single-stranded DNA-binding protein